MRADRDYLNSLHPVCAVIYFAVMMGVTMLENYPVYLLIAFVSAFVYAGYLKGFAVQLKSFKWIIPACILTIIINAAFNHRGVTTLFYLPDGNSFTLESLLYGFNFSLMLCGAVLEFAAFNIVLTSDKTVSLLGRIMPSVSLLISMALRFVPRLSERINRTAAYRDASFGEGKKGVLKKIKNGTDTLSACTTWSFESSVTASDSMRSRGYGGRRSSYSFYSFGRRDGVFCMTLILFGAAAVIPAALGGTDTAFYPRIEMPGITLKSISGSLAFLIFCMLPMIFNALEEIKWRKSLSKI